MESHFIRPMHPKTEIKPDGAAIRRILNLGWWGQLKINGHRAQIHINAANKTCIAYNRHGQVHRKAIPEEIKTDLVRIFGSETGWTVIDAEWIKPQNRMYVFDILKFNNLVLSHQTYEQRLAYIPRVYASEFLSTLPVLSTVEQCMQVFDTEDPLIEGLVLKSRNTPGFKDTSIIRCRRN